MIPHIRRYFQQLMKLEVFQALGARHEVLDHVFATNVFLRVVAQH